MLRQAHGSRAVAIATVVGVVMLAPMFVALVTYAFDSPAIWGAVVHLPNNP